MCDAPSDLAIKILYVHITFHKLNVFPFATKEKSMYKKYSSKPEAYND